MTGGSLRFDLKWWRLTLSELRFTKLLRLFNVCLRQHKIRKLKRIMALAELPRARGRERVVPTWELVFGTLTQNRSSLEPARRALRTAVPLLLILRMEGGTE